MCNSRTSEPWHWVEISLAFMGICRLFQLRWSSGVLIYIRYRIPYIFGLLLAFCGFDVWSYLRVTRETRFLVTESDIGMHLGAHTCGTYPFTKSHPSNITGIGWCGGKATEAEGHFQFIRKYDLRISAGKEDTRKNWSNSNGRKEEVPDGESMYLAYLFSLPGKWE